MIAWSRTVSFAEVVRRSVRRFRVVPVVFRGCIEDDLISIKEVAPMKIRRDFFRFCLSDVPTSDSQTQIVNVHESAIAFLRCNMVKQASFIWIFSSIEP